MCRFLLVKSEEKNHPKTLLLRFAEMAKKSHAPDGDRQGDGWGVAWIDSDNKWQTKKSLSPIWEDKELFNSIPETTSLMVHARSASFPDQKGIIEYNQPYVFGKYAFVFNGFLKSVSFPYPIPGSIGAEKIWYILRKELEKAEPQQALENIKKIIIRHAKEIIGFNIGLADKRNIYSLNYFTKYPEYYQLQYYKNKNFQLICSEKLSKFIF